MDRERSVQNDSFVSSQNKSAMVFLFANRAIITRMLYKHRLALSFSVFSARSC